MQKKLFIKTYGCQMNVYDSARMAEALAPLGYVPVDTVDDADLAILNTCHIREKAAEKVFSELGRLRVLRNEREKPLLIGVAGCVAQAEGAEIQRRAPFVDLVVGPQTYHRLPHLVAQALHAPVVDTDFPAEDKFDLLPTERSVDGPAAFLTVQEGCDKFCTFCVVPYTRGAEASRPLRQVLDEACQLAAKGVREITLLGQNVNAYHGLDENGRPASLATLMRALAAIPGIARLRYTTSHPRDMGDDLIAAHRDLPALMPFLHLPVQSGSDRVLAAMNRRHKADDYRRIVGRLRDARPDIALSSDFIVGFPGETDADFRATMALVEETGFAQAFSFKYSPRPGTPAAEAADAVDEAAKSERLAELQALLLRQQTAFNAACLGRTLPVLLEKPGRHPGQLVGKSPYLQAVSVVGLNEGIGSVVDVMIDTVLSNSLSGVPAGRPAADRAA